MGLGNPPSLCPFPPGALASLLCSAQAKGTPPQGPIPFCHSELPPTLLYAELMSLCCPRVAGQIPFFSERSPLTSPDKDQHSAPHAPACSLRRLCPECLIPTRHHAPDTCWPSGRSDRGPHTRLCDRTPGTASGDGGAPEPYLLSSPRLLPTSRSSCWLCRSSPQTSLCSRSFSPFTQAYSR